jgi:hypothetical protein
MGRIEKIGVAIGGWFLGLAGAIGASALVAWLLDSWQTHRHGVGIGLIVLAIVFWGAVLGVFVLGPGAAVVALKRAGRDPAARGAPHRRLGLIVAAGLAASLLVAVGGVGICIAQAWSPCRGVPPHEAIGGGSFQYVLPSPDGASALLFAAPSGDALGERLYRVDLATGQSALAASFPNGARGPVYLDPDTAVVIELDLGHAKLTLLDLPTGAMRPLTADDVSVYEVAGTDARGGVGFTGFHVTPDQNITTEDQDDPFVGELDVATGEIQELFEPGVTAMRMVPAGTDAVALAQTCLGDCGGGEQVWKLDLTRYL